MTTHISKESDRKIPRARLIELNGEIRLMLYTYNCNVWELLTLESGLGEVSLKFNIKISYVTILLARFI